MEVREGIISVYVDASAQPDNGFLIQIELCFGQADPYQPSVRHCVVRRKTECFVDVGLGFCSPSKEKLGVPDETVSTRQIGVQCQGPLALSDALSHTSR